MTEVQGWAWWATGKRGQTCPTWPTTCLSYEPTTAKPTVLCVLGNLLSHIYQAGLY